jgi:hypothetical protein
VVFIPPVELVFWIDRDDDDECAIIVSTCRELGAIITYVKRLGKGAKWNIQKNLHRKEPHIDSFVIMIEL